MLPLAIDLYCGKGGWAHGLLATGWRVIGFDILGYPDYPAQQVIQDVLTHRIRNHQTMKAIRKTTVTSPKASGVKAGSRR
jgi:hypothetical protein